MLVISELRTNDRMEVVTIFPHRKKVNLSLDMKIRRNVRVVIHSEENYRKKFKENFISTINYNIITL